MCTWCVICNRNKLFYAILLPKIFEVGMNGSFKLNINSINKYTIKLNMKFKINKILSEWLVYLLDQHRLLDYRFAVSKFTFFYFCLRLLIKVDSGHMLLIIMQTFVRLWSLANHTRKSRVFYVAIAGVKTYFTS